MALTIQVYDKETKALKQAQTIQTENPEQCLWLILALFSSGVNITENMDKIPRDDKERLFEFLNDEDKFPTKRYTKRIEEIHEALGLDLAS